MSGRLDQEREKKLQPERMRSCLSSLRALGYDAEPVGDTKIMFTYKDHKVHLYPYSGWHTGKSIKDGRGFQKLLKQLK
jgi:hypothetical protein